MDLRDFSEIGQQIERTVKNAVDSMNHFFLNHEMFVAGSSYWNMAYGRIPGDVEYDIEGISNMENLGKNMAFLLKALCSKD